MRKVVALLLLSALPACVLAEDAPRPFTGDINAAYLRSTGSSSKEDLKARLDTQYVHDEWTHQFKVEGVNEFESASGLRTAERYLVLERSGWNFTSRDYLFLKTQYEKDQQTDNDYQVLMAAGYGRKVIKTETMFLDVDLGAGNRYSKNDRTGAEDSETVGNLALKYEWKFRSGGRLVEDASADIGESSTVVRTRTALVFDLTDVIGLTMAYETKSDDGPSDINDTMTTVGLNYRFK
ncbi:MAG: DUF481 domain-containing protein [bacterium]|nr:DUF481 domain-containing protein [bacterium]